MQLLSPVLRAVVVAALTIAAGTGCSTVRSVERSLTYVTLPPQTEAAMGEEYAEQVRDEYQFVEDEFIQTWLDEMGAELVRYSPGTRQDFQFSVTATEAVNAFAVPGGFCYVNAGLILFADNEAQVAAVVAHEINHITMRHSMLQIQRGLGLQLVTLLAASAFESSQGRAATVVAGQGLGALAQRKFGRDDEREADRKGVKAMYEAGWDPREAAAFFGKLNRLSEGGSPNFLQQLVSTHPPTDERIENIREQIAGYPLGAANLRVDSEEFREVQARLREMGFRAPGEQAPAGESDAQIAAFP